MDVLHKTLSQVGDTIYFLTSSVEEPYYWIRMKGEIMETSITDTVITYRIQLKEILEPNSIIRTCIAGKHFRIRSIRKVQKPFLDYAIKCRLDVPDAKMSSHIINQMKSRWFDVSIMTTFLDEQSMCDTLQKVNKHNIDVLMRRADFLSHRNLEI